MHRRVPSVIHQLLHLAALLIPGLAIAQTTRITGKVTDATTGEALPFVSVTFVDSRISTNTDFDGIYHFDTYYATDSLRATCMGYKPMTVKVKRDKEQKIDLVLQPSTAELAEVVITPTENSAFTILRHVIANKPANNRAKLAAYQYENYNKVEFDLNNITEDFKKKKLFKQFDFVFDYVDSSGAKPYLPIFMTETLSDVFYRQTPHTRREIIKGSRVSGIENESIVQFMGDMYQNVNIYENFMIIFGKNFVSPIADGGKGYYQYFLVDSNWVGHNWCYHLTFKPSHAQQLSFSGDMWVNDTTFAVRRINASIEPGANINFVQGFDVHQEYDMVKPEVYMLTKDQLVADLNIIKDAGEPNKHQVQGFFGRRTATFKDFVINEPKEDGFYAGASEVVVDKDPANDSEDFWLQHRHVELSKQEAAIYHMVDTMKTIPIFRTYIDLVNTVVTGYYKLGLVEVGPFFNFFSYNPVEGQRLRVGVRTSNKFSKNVEYETYLAYGFLDEELKYGFGGRTFITKDPRQLIGAYYKHDIEQLGQSPTSFKQDNIFSSTFRRTANTKLTMVNEYKLTYDRDWFQGFSNSVQFRYRTLYPRGSLTYQQYNDPAGEPTTISSITTFEVAVNTRFAWHEKFANGTFRRVSLRTRAPAFELHTAYGFPHVLNSDYEYTRVVLKISQRVPIGVLGNFRYAVEGGRIWGTLPYPLLILHPGNEIFYFDENSYNTMNYFEFISDRYASISLENHFDGFFFNRVPLFRKLKWREIIAFKAVIGELDPKHRQELIFLPNMNDLHAGPFAEAGVGVENILKIIRVDGVWRLTYRDLPNAALFALRLKLSIRF